MDLTSVAANVPALFMTPFQVAQEFTRFFAIAANLVLFYFIYKRRLFGRFPFYSAYLILTFLRQPYRIWLDFASPFSRETTQLWIYWGYWGSEGLQALLTLGILRELYLELLAPLPNLRDSASFVYRWCVAAILCLAVFTAYFIHPPFNERIGNTIGILEPTIKIFQICMVLLLFVFTYMMGVSRKNLALSIAIGFAVVWIISAATSIVFNLYGLAAIRQYALIKPLAYVCALLIWCQAFAKGATEAVELRLDDPAAARLMEWDRALDRIAP